MNRPDQPAGVAAETTEPTPTADEHRLDEHDDEYEQAAGTSRHGDETGLATEEHDSPVVDRDEPDLVPDAIEAAKTSNRETSTPADRELARARGVEWVRPTDLIARQSAALAGRGIDLHTELARRTRTLTTAAARTAAERARGLPPLSAFGRSRTPQSPSRAAVGMN